MLSWGIGDDKEPICNQISGLQQKVLSMKVQDSIVLDQSSWSPSSPLHKDFMKEIGDACAGWLENKEETKLKNHLRWVRIRVQGPKEIFRPTKVELSDGKLIFALPIWCEYWATFKPVMESEIDYRGDNKKSKEKVEASNVSDDDRLSEHGKE